MAVPTYPWQPAQIPLWPREGESGWRQYTGELRVVGGLTLPNRIVDRPWLDSRARQVAADALRSSPVAGPRSVTGSWLVTDGPGWVLGGWDIDEARATTVRLSTGHSEIRLPVVHGGIRRTFLDGRGYLDLSGRFLSFLVALRWPRADDRPSPLPLDVFYWALLASLATVYSTCRHVARAMDAAEPSDIRPSEAWLTSDTRRVMDAVDISQFDRESFGMPEGANFPCARPPTTDMPDLDNLVRNWLTYWLLDIGTYDFEGWLAGLEAPDWIRSPVLELPQ
jgi:hypothetical protein